MKRHAPTAPRDAAIQSALAALRHAPEEAVQALAALCAAARSPQAAREIDAALAGRAPLYAALASPLPKARKNAARLMGALGARADVPALVAALAAEQTRFVRPSMILALGALGGDAAYTALNALPLPENEADKHDREEAEAIRTARARLAPRVRHAFTGLPGPMDVFLTTPPGMGGLLAGELAALALPCRRVEREGVWTQAEDVSLLYRARCFAEALFPLALDVALPEGPFDPAAAARLLAGPARVPLATLLTGSHAGAPPFSYRVECRGKLERGAFARAFAAQLDADGALLQNAPAQYECEVRVCCKAPRPGGPPEQPSYAAADVFCRLTTFPDTRFAYRRHAVSASIQPALAAALARYALGFAPSRPLRVLDPCCGSGTLLIEMEKLCAQPGQVPCESLLGLDIVGDTAGKARENVAAAHSRAHILHKDCRAFEAREPVDLLLCNLPFGLRVGTHESNEALYAALAARLPQWLAPDGVALLYTMEYRLLMKCLRAVPALAIREETRTAAGGLAPWVVVCSPRTLWKKGSWDS